MQTILIRKIPFSLPTRFQPGHQCSEGEARVLNQLYITAVRKGVQAKVDEGADRATLQALVTGFAEKFEFGRTAATRALDPVETEARRIAKAQIIAHLQSHGKDPKDFKEVMDERVEQLLARDPRIREEARRRYEASLAIASDSIEDLLAEAAE